MIGNVAQSRLPLGAAASLLVALAGCQPDAAPASAPTATEEPAPSTETKAQSRESTPAVEPLTPTPTVAEEVPEEAGPTERFPSFGLAFTAPEGWRAEPELPRFGFLGRWLPPGDDADDWSQFAVDLRSLGGSAEARAQAYRQAIAQWVGRGYRQTEIDLDGVEAVRLDAPPLAPGAERQPVPSPILITRRSRILYRTLFLLNDPQQTADAEALFESWRWIEPTTVVQHLELSAPQSLFDGLGEIRVPAIARVDPEFGSEDSLGFTTFDYNRLQDALIVVFERDLKPDPESLREHVVSYAKSIEGRAGLDSPLSFSLAEGRTDLYTSDPIEGQFEEGGRTVRRLCRYAVWRPKTGAIIRLQAVINNEVFSNDERLAAAVRAVDRVFKSCSERSDGGTD